MSKHLQRAIDRLMEHLIALSAKVESNVRLSIQALDEMDRSMVRQVIEADEEIDKKEIEIEEECLQIFALHQPVAVDLRYLVAVLKINNDLERIGDLAVNIARHALNILDSHKLHHRFKYQEITEKVQEMLKNSLDSLIQLSPDIATKVLKTDDEVDAMDQTLCQEVLGEMVKNPEHVGILIHFLHISRHLERIADHATNIAEDIIYLTRGDIIRHGQ